MNAGVRKLQAYSGTVVLELCHHDDLHEIGEDIDQHGKPLRLVRCQQCSLLIREYLPTD
jgi:hypothetical protein